MLRGYHRSVRLTGHAGSARGPGPRGHVCLVHDHAAGYRRRPAAFSTEGLRAAPRVAHASPDGPEAARTDLALAGSLDWLPYARAHGVAPTLRSPPPCAARLMELLPAASLQCAGSEATR